LLCPGYYPVVIASPVSGFTEFLLNFDRFKKDAPSIIPPGGSIPFYCLFGAVYYICVKPGGTLMPLRKFVTAINCMDGRVQEPVIAYLKNRFQAEFVDMITEPGPIKCLAENDNHHILESIRQKLHISHHTHGSQVVALVGHHDCAGHKVDRETKLGLMEKAEARLREWGFNVDYIRLYVNDAWQVEEIA